MRRRNCGRRGSRRHRPNVIQGQAAKLAGADMIIGVHLTHGADQIGGATKPSIKRFTTELSHPSKNVVSDTTLLVGFVGQLTFCAA